MKKSIAIPHPTFRATIGREGGGCFRAESKIEKLEEATESYNELLEEERRLKEIADAFSKYHETKSHIQKLEDEYKKANEAYGRIHELYAKEEEKWLNNQAAILAASLKPGMPCPVCGSTEHHIQHKETTEIVEQDELKN